METKRCPYCHKLVRADASTCSRCGHTFVSSKPIVQLSDVSTPSVPPASPHRAGHYSGLHPEDQPYQSSMIAIQHPPTPEQDGRRPLRGEPQQIVLPAPAPAPHTPLPVHALDELPPPETARVQAQAVPILFDAPVVPATPAPLYVGSARPSRPTSSLLFSRRAIPVLLALSAVFFLLASGILGFIFIKKQTAVAVTTLVATPNTLRVGDTFALSGNGFGANSDISFTYDADKIIVDGSGQHALGARTDAQGTFSVKISVPSTWITGDHSVHATDTADKLSVSTHVTVQQAPSAPPHLQLSVAQLDLGSSEYQGSITLNNTGGGQVIWQASSDASWLTATPTNGTFNGRALVTITVNRSGLTPQNYGSHLMFKAQGSTDTLILTVVMTVKPTPATLNISTSALSFSSIVGQSAGSQTITVQNSGGTALNWSSVVTTGDGSAWLAVTPASGRLAPNTSAILVVDAQTQQLAVGQYSATITFAGGVGAQIVVSLNVFAPGNLTISSALQSFSVTQGQNPASTTLMLQNSGGLPINWTASANQANWLSVSPASGTLQASEQINISVNVKANGLKTGTYQGMLTFGFGSSIKQVTVSLTIMPPPQPIIAVQTSALTFTTYMGQNPAPQTLTFSNTGNAPLHWVATEDGNGATFAPLSLNAGTLAAGTSATLTVTPNVVTAVPGALVTTITLADSDTGTTVISQKIPITVNILNQANITLSSNNLTINNTATTPHTSTVLQISNTGSVTLNWTAAPLPSAPWLSVDVTSGSVAPGNNAVVNVQCDSSQLTPGTYTAILTISDSDANTPVQSQNVQITLTVV